MREQMARQTMALVLSVIVGLPATAWAQDRATDALIKFHQSRAAADPENFLAFNSLAGAYIQKARESGDLTYYDLAEKAALRSLDLLNDYPAASPAMTYLAAVDLAKHRFREARERAQKALDLDPRTLAAHGVLGDAAFEMGDYEAAEAAYAKLLTSMGARHPHSRLAALHFIRGEPEVAIQALQRAVRAATEANTSRENVAWHRAQLADAYFEVGDLAAAGASYESALAAFPRYHRALAGLGKVRAGQQRFEEAVTLYREAIGVIPLPDYAAALGDVLTRLGRGADARKQYDLVEYIGRLSALNKSVYNRELAFFYAEHDLKPAVAVDLARRELEVRHDVYTHDVLAWALLKDGQPRQALAEMEQALKLHTRDARLYFHAGMIHLRLGDRDKAKDYLRLCVATNRHFHVLYAAVAERALAGLEASASSGAHDDTRR
jgi:tetratricopeptide (TPR) repeat protein